MKAEFTITQEAKAVIARLEKAVKKYPTNATKLALLYADTAVIMIKKGIEGQSIPMAPLTGPWLLRKAKGGLDTRILIATGRYLRGLRVTKGDVAGTAYLTGDTRLGHFLEYGTKRMPARPHVRPTLDILGSAVKQGRVKEIINDLLGR